MSKTNDANTSKAILKQDYGYRPAHLQAWMINLRHTNIKYDVPTHSAGATARPFLHQLPQELQAMILRHSTTLAMTRLLLVNKATHEAVATWPEFARLVKYGSRFLCTLVRTNMLHQTSVHQLYVALTTDRCKFCGCHAAFVCLIRIWRCCFYCMETCPSLLPIALSRGRDWLHGGRLLREVPQLEVIVPGRYGMLHPYNLGQRLTLVMLSDVHSLRTGEVYVSSESLQRQYPVTLYTFRKKRYTWASCTAVPVLKTPELTLDRGTLCRGCEYTWTSPNKTYSPKEFKQHKAECGGVAQLQQMSQKAGQPFQSICTNRNWRRSD